MEAGPPAQPEVQQMTHGILKRKTPGEDEIPNGVLRYLPPTLLDVATSFNAVLSPIQVEIHEDNSHTKKDYYFPTAITQCPCSTPQAGPLKSSRGPGSTIIWTNIVFKTSSLASDRATQP
ncbi:hypothetical protein Trydic_g17149 [Trypoxylus dichotomus]